MSKKQKSELQKAADRIRELQVNIEGLELTLQQDRKLYEETESKLKELDEEIQKQHDELFSLNSKLNRERANVAKIVNPGYLNHVG